MLEIKGLTKTYAKGNVRAVDGLTLTVRSGEIFGFIGPNGAGKTTTIKMLTGLLRPDEGSITIDGCSLADDPIGAKMRIGYVPDNHDIYDMLSGAEYLNFMADIYGVPADKRAQRMKYYLDLFSLSGHSGEPIKSYSHGMKQKLVITGALLHSPSLWILDEPMVGLDPKSALLLKQEMRARCNEGCTVFFSTHVLEVAEKLCDRIGIISGGRLIASGTLDELRHGQNESLENIFMECTEG